MYICICIYVYMYMYMYMYVYRCVSSIWYVKASGKSLRRHPELASVTYLGACDGDYRERDRSRERERERERDREIERDREYTTITVIYLGACDDDYYYYHCVR